MSRTSCQEPTQAKRELVYAQSIWDKQKAWCVPPGSHWLACEILTQMLNYNVNYGDPPHYQDPAHPWKPVKNVISIGLSLLIIEIQWWKSSYRYLNIWRIRICIFNFMWVNCCSAIVALRSLMPGGTCTLSWGYKIQKPPTKGILK